MRALLALAFIGIIFTALPAQAAVSACSNPPTVGSTCPGATCSSLGQTQMSQDNQNIIACVYNASSALVWKTTSASAACSGNQVVTSIVNGIPACGAASPAVTVVNCPAGQVVLGVVNGVPQCGTVAAANVSCGANLVMTGVNASGQPMCSSSDGNLSCPAGQVLVGVSNDTPSCVAPGNDVSATCPSGQVLQGVVSGSPECVVASALFSGPTGGGTGNYVAKWTGPSTLGTGDLYDNGNVGVGKTNPAQKLDVAGDIAVDGVDALRDDGTNAYLFPWSTGNANNTVVVGGGATTNLTVTGTLRAGSSSIGTNGYTTLPNGLILQWGTAQWGGGGNKYQVYFPTAFPSACLSVVFTAQSYTGQHTSVASIVQGSITQSGFKWNVGSSSSIDGWSNPLWMAIGY